MVVPVFVKITMLEGLIFEFYFGLYLGQRFMKLTLVFKLKVKSLRAWRPRPSGSICLETLTSTRRWIFITLSTVEKVFV